MNEMNNPIKTLRLKRFAHLGRIYSQEELAEALDLNQSRVSRLQSAELSDISFGDLERLRKFFEFQTIDQMLHWDPDAPEDENSDVSMVAEPERPEYRSEKPREVIQILLTLDGTEETASKAIELVNLNHKHLKGS